MYREWLDLDSRGQYFIKILAAWIGAIAVTGLPVIMFLNAVTV